MSEAQYLYLTTIGRRSGEPREIEIWFTAHNGRYYLIAEHREQTQWVKNILHHPRISFRVDKDHFKGQGRIVDEVNETALWQAIRALSDKKYGWSDGLIVELLPD